MKKLLLFLVVFAAVFSCGKSEDKKDAGAGQAANSGDKIKIELVSKGYQHEFWRSVEAGAKKAGEELGVEVNFIGPEKETEIGKQVGMVENAINKKVTALGIAALDPDALAVVAKKAMDAQIPVVTFDSNVKDDITSSFIATDNKAAGAMAGEQLAKLINGKGKVAVVSHNPGTTTAIEREAGFREALAKYPDIKILNTQFSDGDKSKALAITLDIINANPDIAGIYGTNEPSIFGVAKGVEEKGLTGKVALVGIDSSEDLAKFLEKGVISGLVIQDPYNMGYQTVQQLYKLSKGEKVEKRIDTGAILVTKENINNPDITKKMFPFGRK